MTGVGVYVRRSGEQLSSCNLEFFVVWDGVGSLHEAGQALFWHCIRKLYIGHYRFGTCMRQTGKNRLAKNMTEIRIARLKRRNK